MSDSLLTPDQQTRLDRESILWLTTVRPNGQPQTLPVWYVLDGSEILVWSFDGVRVKNLATNSKVSAHVNNDGRGGNILTIEGTAVIDRKRGLASEHAKYVDRYQSFLSSYDWTWDWFCGKYSVPIVITPSKAR